MESPHGEEPVVNMAVNVDNNENKDMVFFLAIFTFLCLDKAP